MSVYSPTASLGVPGSSTDFSRLLWTHLGVYEVLKPVHKKAERDGVKGKNVLKDRRGKSSIHWNTFNILSQRSRYFVS